MEGIERAKRIRQRALEEAFQRMEGRGIPVDDREREVLEEMTRRLVRRVLVRSSALLSGGGRDP